jgi:glyoxylate/hydroxypyruvate reductase A
MGFLAAMPRLTWVQNSGAGVDHLVSHPELPDAIPITRADGQFGYWMARYVAAHLLAGAQQLQACRDAQMRAEWTPKLLPEDLTGKLALVLGFGRIGLHIARTLREMGMQVHGIGTSPRTQDGFPVHAVEEAPARLEHARALILCAPLTPRTRDLVDARFLAGARELTLINVGRGELVKLEDLQKALDSGWVKEAILDVFPEEPLPESHWLWRHPKVTVTPHHSGPSTPRQLIPDILDNLHRFARGEAIQGAVDRRRGY